MKGSLRKHVARDGDVTWRVRVEFYDAHGKRHQPQRTFPTMAAAQDGLRVWRQSLALAAQGTPGDDAIAREPRTPIPPGAWSCLRAIAAEAHELQWRWQVYSAARVALVLRFIEECALAGLTALTPQEMPTATGPAPEPWQAGTPGGYYVYRLLADGVPFYVGQSRDILARVRAHIRQATTASRVRDRSARTFAVREALAQGKALTFDVVATAPTAQEIRQLERQWIVRLIAEGHVLANDSGL